MSPIDGDRSKTHVIIVNEVDLKGHVPEWAMRTVMKDQGYQIDKLRKIIPRWKEQFPGERP
jgi:hydrogenase maturation factor